MPDTTEAGSSDVSVLLQHTKSLDVSVERRLNAATTNRDRRRREQWNAMKTNRIVVITGAAGGMGALFVERFLANADTVIATDTLAAPIES
jgi:FlaA1/EpsC-like NDP-sugar epimerase